MIKIALVVCVICMASRVAAADEAKAKQYFQAGAKAYAAQNFEAAAANFDQAFKEMPMPEIAFSAAQAYRRLYRVDAKPAHVRRAVELYRSYLDKVKTGGRVGDASDNLGEMERELDKLEAQGKAGKLRVEVASERTRMGVSISKADQSAPDTSVLREIGEGTGDTLKGVVATLDGQPIEPFALNEVEPGDHVVSVTAEGYFPIEKKQRAVQGVPSLVVIELQPKPARIKVATEVGARITVDGSPITGSMLELATGKHVIAVLRHGRRPFGRELMVTRGQELVLDATLEKTGRRRAVPWVLGGAGGLALIATISGIAAVVADGNAIDARDQIAAGNASPTIGNEYDRQVQRRDELKTTAIVFGAGALVAGAVGLGLYFFDSPSSEGVRIVPVVGSGTAGVSAARRF
ncbi:MAG: hypothetical protein H0V17_01340 [Deltaproteobacteria bacterium]|nr:hypothetical protein [Deltaproteobacteria bacterium]